MTKSSNVFPFINPAHVQAMLADAEPVKTVRPNDPEPGEPLDGVPTGKWVPDELGLPEGCPVVPLGVHGDRCWLLDEMGQVRFLDPPYGKGHLLGMFNGRHEYLIWAWPRFGKDKLISGFDNMAAASSILKACATKGVWSPSDAERWQGCWRGAGGDLVVHTGHSVIVAGRAEAPGEYDGYVYPAMQRIPGPMTYKGKELPLKPAQLLRPILRSWNWERPEIDPHLLLGWIGAAYLSAALKWRPMVFITGDKAVGKSTLQGLLKGIFGDWLVSAADTTAAGLYQRIGLSARPIAVDELESEHDNKKVVAVLKLARLAASGDVFLRGGDRHTGVKFNARSAFLFSSINAPPLPPQDLSRMALLRLRKLEPGVVAPPTDEAVLGLIGRCILRRLMQEWRRFDATYDAFAEELAAGGMDGRGQAQFGTLLTCADLIEHEGWDDARLKFALEHEGELVAWRDLLKPSDMHEFEDQVENWYACLQHLLSVRVDAWRNGVRHSIGQVVLAFWDQSDKDLAKANHELSQAGLRIIVEKRKAWLFVPNSSPLVRELYEGSHWAGALGAGVWSAAIRQGPRGTLWRPGHYRISGSMFRGTLVALEGLYGEGGVMAEEQE